MPHTESELHTIVKVSVAHALALLEGIESLQDEGVLANTRESMRDSHLRDAVGFCFGALSSQARRSRLKLIIEMSTMGSWITVCHVHTARSSGRLPVNDSIRLHRGRS